MIRLCIWIVAISALQILSASDSDKDIRNGTLIIDEKEYPVKFDVVSEDDHGKIDSIEMERDEAYYKFDELKQDDEKLSFEIDTGDIYYCELYSDLTRKSEINNCLDKEGHCGESTLKGSDEKSNMAIHMLALPVLEESEAAEGDDTDKNNDSND